ncbi:unnamed protein product [Rotaria socialis]|uniref:Calpain catalytic domain-containing protein n=1 Tax=Rotaria socialis TaxID=392032 RepID=A0A820PZ29_9BILA|nr:unnamed protein product [Rotaria socialis]
MERRRKRQEQQQQQQQQPDDNIHRARSRKLSLSLDIVNKPNFSPPRVAGIRSLLSREIHSVHDHVAESSQSVGSIAPVERKFSDPEFLPLPESIARGDEGTSFLGVKYQGRVAGWLRPERIRWPTEDKHYPIAVFNQPHPKDIIQGRLGNCWLIAALSLIAEVPQILYKVMITKRHNPVGLYRVRLCNQGIWQVVTIDDLLPVSTSNSLVFSRSKKKQLFAPLIEKALAKMHGSYMALKSGRCDEGLQTLTGEPCEVLFLRSSDPEKKPDLNQIWLSILQSRVKGYLMTCPCSNKRFSEQIFNRMGLESDHAYSILDARQVNSQRLVRLRNPWGEKEWKGAVHENWTKWPKALRNKLTTSSVNDGVFWMPWEQMPSFFSSVTICKVNANWHEARKRGQFSDFSSTITSAYGLECPYGAELEIEVFNAGDGNYYNRLKDPDVDLFLILLSSNGYCRAYKHDVDYYITLSTVVPPGRYLILAGSMSVVNYMVYPAFNLVVHGSQPFVVHDQPASYELVADAFHAVAVRANNRQDMGGGVSILTFDDNGNFGLVCENKSNRTVRLSSNFQGSKNVLSSRHAFQMIDTIPARKQQLIAIFTRKMFSNDVQIAYQASGELLDPDHYTRAKNNPPIPPQAYGNVFENCF